MWGVYRLDERQRGIYSGPETVPPLLFHADGSADAARPAGYLGHTLPAAARLQVAVASSRRKQRPKGKNRKDALPHKHGKETKCQGNRATDTRVGRRAGD